MERVKKVKVKKKAIIGLTIIVIGLAIFYMKMPSIPLIKKELKEEVFLASNTTKVIAYNEELKEEKIFTRGKKVNFFPKNIKEVDEVKYNEIEVDKKRYYVNSLNLEKNLENVVKEKLVYVRTNSTLYKDIENGTIEGIVKKGEELNVVGFDKLNEDGNVNSYKIKNNNKEGYVYKKYLVNSKEESLLNYKEEEIFSIHKKRGNTLGAGSASNLDFYPVEKVSFEDNKMPEKVNAFYLNSSSLVINNVEKYIELAKNTSINAFVVDIKDNQAPGYKSLVMKKYSPTNYKYANNEFESYKNAIKKLKDAGFYVIGRITVFKDKYYIDDHKEDAIIDKRTNKPYLKSSSYWPTAYSRNVWEFNVELAKEAIREMKFNEIQFDYVRFPDRTQLDEKKNIIDFQNKYNEEKAEAIQDFLFYAKDQIHKEKAYLSVDVFGEAANSYVTAYGQYWGAISNIVDAISGMPYPDHFSKNSYGLKTPWTEPYKLMYYWGKSVATRQSEIPTPAKVRTWIQVYDVPSYKHPGGLTYGSKQVLDQIKGLTDAQVNDGYMTWNSSSSITRYKNQISAYK